MQIKRNWLTITNPNGFTIATKGGLLELDATRTYTRWTLLLGLIIWVLLIVIHNSLETSVSPFSYSSAPVVNGSEAINNSTYCGLYFTCAYDVDVILFSSDVFLQQYTSEGPQLRPISEAMVPELPFSFYKLQRDHIYGILGNTSAILEFRHAVAPINGLEIRGLYGSQIEDYVLNTTDEFCPIPFLVHEPINSALAVALSIVQLIAIVVAPLCINRSLCRLGIWHGNLIRDRWIKAMTALPFPRSGNNRFQSFVPERPNNWVQSYVDGEDTFNAIFNALETAQHEIFIAGWWICPDLYLRRPTRALPSSMLKDILLRKAQAGVEIYVLMYREVEMVLTLDSAYSSTELQVHENIHILRDPDFQLECFGFWSHHEKIVCIDQGQAFVGGLDLCFGRYDTPCHSLVDTSSSPIWRGKDYSNPRIKDFVQVDQPFEDLIDRQTTPRMPWHDIHCSISGPAGRDIALHFIQRWNFVCAFKQTHRRTAFCPLCRCQSRRKHYPAIVPYAPDAMNHREEHHTQCKVQVVRSVSQWSAGVPTEKSIQDAYIHLIQHAQHSIYIENQFFVSGLDPNPRIQNRILQALVDRIKRASRQKEQFRVYVLLPLLPAFEGNLKSPEFSNLHAVMHWQYQTICRGPSSLFGELAKFTTSPEAYVGFYGLRRSEMMPNKKFSTEQIYIHSKLMIVDDEKAIIGSANINDRSMNGNRDSEIAVVLDSKPLCTALRLQLFQEHLGLPNQDFSTIEDAHSEETWQMVQLVAQTNTQIYEHLFACAPSDSMPKFLHIRESHASGQKREANVDIDQLKAPMLSRETLTSGSSAEEFADIHSDETAFVTREFEEHLSRIRGHLVEFPLHFLIHEDLRPKMLPKDLHL